MGQSYRIKTELGVNKTINVQLDQDFEFLEILSLKIQQSDIYTRSCADYGVIVGRVTANNGFGIPNARVSVFVPIRNVDQSNPLISSIYPYKSPSDKNEDGYRYNLLPYEKSYSAHAATGTLPTRDDALTGSTAVEIYDTYYKYTTKTNESGDYMIMGAPLGAQTLVMDVDLSDIGEFSLTPQDLIRMGLASEGQVAGNRFKTSNDLSSLPQIISLTKQLDVSPLWGDPDICQIAVSRVDFDLRDDANVDIQPTSVFMGSIFSSGNKFRVRKNCKPNDNLGNLCGLTTSPGQIIAIRQTIQQDSDGNPILEQYQLEQSGNIIDGSGVWMTELPMNLDYYITNEFGEKVISNDPTVGIPTKGKYRFKVKWQQPNDLTLQTRRAYYLVPNVKEYGWSNSEDDPYTQGTESDREKLGSSYYFGLDWSGYTNGFTSNYKTERLNEIINCEDTFYQFDFNRVYTVSSMVDQYKKGNKGQFIGIKEIDDDSCDSGVNKFPVNDGFRNFDLLFFLFSILLTVITPAFLSILVAMHIILFVYNLILTIICAICEIRIPVIRVRPFKWLCRVFGVPCDKRSYVFRIPMITYPDCQACDCKQETSVEVNNDYNKGNPDSNGILTNLSLQINYNTMLESIAFSSFTENEATLLSTVYSQVLAGNSSSSLISDTERYKLPISSKYTLRGDTSILTSKSLPIGERINLFNQRSNYFTGVNRIKVSFSKNENIGVSHYDNTLTVLSQEQFNAGDLLSFVGFDKSSDINFSVTASTTSGITQGISGSSYNGSGQTSVNVSYANPNDFTQTSETQVNYVLPYGSVKTNYQFPSDVEYYQVITAITVSQAAAIWNSGTTQSFGNVLESPTSILRYESGPYNTSLLRSISSVRALDYFEDYDSQYILILQRGVDPYSPLYLNEYKLGSLFGVDEDDSNWTISATTRLNIPIQKLINNSVSIQSYDQNSMFYQSYFFNPGSQFSAFTTSATTYYSRLDKSTFPIPSKFAVSGNKVLSTTSNGFWFSSPSSTKYDNSEDVSGVAAMSCRNYNTTLYSDAEPSSNIGEFSYSYFEYSYYTKIFPQNNLLTFNLPQRNILRTDRLPSSDYLDGSSWDNNPALLQQNNNFQIYQISTERDSLSSNSFTTGADQVTADLEGLPEESKVLQSFDCEGMVSLKCYEGFGGEFGINESCEDSDAVENGCYMFMRKPLIDLIRDIGTFGEWSFRFRFFYGLCRGVLAQSFMNNWINGSLYMFPIQVDTYFNKNNQPQSPIYCKDLAYFDINTNNFYYRSSPYNYINNRFVGNRTNNNFTVNTVNLMFPTTIINLGIKDSFYSEIVFDPSTKGYILPNIDTTSYGDTSDLINLFVISRITDEGFLAQIIPLGDNSLQQLFSRNETNDILGRRRRIDGDLAQLMSINCEIGNINFSPQFYETTGGPPTTILGNEENPTIAVWFSSTTQDLQTKDYLTPGRINFRGQDNVGYYPYPYGIKSQVVPFYQWELDIPTNNSSGNLFGGQYNNWATSTEDIIQNTPYQGLDRASLTTKYFLASNVDVSSEDLLARGYIFGVDDNGNYSSSVSLVRNPKFLVGAPYQFYFGVVKGESALDKFKTKYSIDE
jgi:hypothetical protein